MADGMADLLSVARYDRASFISWVRATEGWSFHKAGEPFNKSLSFADIAFPQFQNMPSSSAEFSGIYFVPALLFFRALAANIQGGTSVRMQWNSCAHARSSHELAQSSCVAAKRCPGSLEALGHVSESGSPFGAEPTAPPALAECSCSECAHQERTFRFSNRVHALSLNFSISDDKSTC